MAEAAVEVLKLTIDLILYSPGFDFEGIRPEVSKIKLELESMQSFLRDAERYKDGHDGLSCWATQVRDAALKAEDVLDEFLYHLYSVKHGGFLGFLRRAVVFPKEMWNRCRTVNRLKEFKREIKDIAKRSKRYDLSNREKIPNHHHSLNYAQNIGETSFFVENTAIIGIDEESHQLLEWLIDGEKQRTVTSIVGMGGSGKTTLAAHAYNSLAVKKSFDCFVWVSVSQKYMIEELLKEIIKALSSSKSASPDFATNYKQLVETIVNLFEGKRYLIVLDDVWSSILWKQVNAALPDHNNGSRVIITTRMEDIASYPYGAGSHVLHCKPLLKEEAWKLFCNKAFCGEPCPLELQDIASKLLDKCDGLPLAILALGGLMAPKDRTELKWREVYNSLNWHITENPLLDEVKTILFLSIKELPYFLKNCFMYCCCFPIEQWVGAGRLIRMWMAEGFLEERKGLSLEDVGKIYLRELIHRNILQVEKHNSLMRPKLCKLHDLMWEIAHFISERENFLSICIPQDLEVEIKARRISLHVSDWSSYRPGQDMRYLRTFCAFNVKDREGFPLDGVLSNFRLLRVLELIGAPIDSLPKTLGKLFNLRYLGLKHTKISELPVSISRLRNLQTLDIRRTLIKELPKEIGKLRKLRHLLVYTGSDEEVFYYVSGMKGPNTIVELKDLQVVNCLEANSDLVQRIGELTQLRRLELTNLKEDDGTALCASIEKMKDLHHLLLVAKDENEYLQIGGLSSTPLVLRKLTLAGRLRDIPHWLSSLRNVMYLHLHWSQLTMDPIPCLSKLPVLERLTLINACSDEIKELCFETGFLRLEDLYISRFPELVEIVIHEGTMPKLMRMTLNKCKRLRRVPPGIEYLRNLEKLQLNHMSEELIAIIYSNNRVELSKLRLIPSKVYERTSSVLYGEHN
ncbi:disease resistance protein RPM1-like [Andrographis paniculata]|uniref:disease resistance protein RPM1-like n=1 Tax=Andrographis paniculata TaxID=175694 RepID=UPI0021E6FEC8|nr:disease resistance protein RPM1-like [Andrographis paniculata]XP_051137092.1 disease resistance protein RPM1-like [Andrographis paniculata]